MALVTTVGGSTTDSHVTVSEATTYFTDYKPKFIATWNALTDGNKEAYLRESTSALDMFSDWRGIKAFDDQALEFPRELGYISYDLATEYPSGEIHYRIKRAQMELSMLLVINLADDSTIENRCQEELKALSGTVEIKYKKRFDHALLERISGTSTMRVKQLIKPWMATTRLERR